MRLPQVFRDFRLLVEAVRQLALMLGELVDALREVVAVNKGLGPMVDRVEALELARHHFEAECAGQLLRSEGKLKAANNSEARERQLKKSYESQLILGDDPGEKFVEERDAIVQSDVDRGEAEGLRPLRMDVAPDHKQAALRAKWGVTA